MTLDAQTTARERLVAELRDYALVSTTSPITSA